MSRGVIATPAIINIHTYNSFTVERSLSPEEIRYYALYWDKVIIPTSNLIHMGLPEEDILIESGVIERPRVGFSGSFDTNQIANSFVESQSIVAKQLMEEDLTTDWVLHQIGNKLNLPTEYMDTKRSLRFELINLLPVPSGSIPIVDILEFKYRRADELNSLHHTIESAYIEALKCPDYNLGATTAIRELQKSIESLDVVAKEAWERTSKFDFTVEFNLDGGKIASGIAVGSVFDYYTNMSSFPLGKIIGGIASMFTLKASYSSSFKSASNNTALAFLSHAHKECIITNR